MTSRRYISGRGRYISGRGRYRAGGGAKVEHHTPQRSREGKGVSREVVNSLNSGFCLPCLMKDRVMNRGS